MASSTSQFSCSVGTADASTADKPFPTVLAVGILVALVFTVLFGLLDHWQAMGVVMLLALGIVALASRVQFEINHPQLQPVRVPVRDE